MIPDNIKKLENMSGKYITIEGKYFLPDSFAGHTGFIVIPFPCDMIETGIVPRYIIMVGTVM